jgi:hypothetical protein
MKIIGSILGCLALLMPTAATGDEVAPVFEPTGPWAMEYADETCRLVRNFSDGETALTLAFERSFLGPWLRLGLSSDGLTARSGTTQARFRYTSDTRSRSSELLRSSLADGRQGFLLPSASLLSPEELEYDRETPFAGLAQHAEAEIVAAEGISTITFSEGFNEDPVLRIGPMAAPIRAMQACVTDLVVGWGIDPQRFATMSRHASPDGNPQSWLSYRDYPPELLRAGRGGVLSLRLIISEEGTVERCLFDVEVRGPFEDIACNRIKQRARFNPGLDADGKPVRAYWSVTVRFSA